MAKDKKKDRDRGKRDKAAKAAKADKPRDVSVGPGDAAAPDQAATPRQAARPATPRQPARPATPRVAPAARATTSVASGATAPDPAAGQHHAAKAHGRATQVDESLPATRQELMALHAAARARRNGAPLDSPDFRAAVMDLERIEIRIAAVDRAADPPLG